MWRKTPEDYSMEKLTQSAGIRELKPYQHMVRRRDSNRGHVEGEERYHLDVR